MGVSPSPALRPKAAKRDLSPSARGELPNRALAEPLLQRGELIVERLGQLRAECREMLVDQRQLRLPAFLVNMRQLLHILRGDLEAVDVERTLGRKPSDRR